MKLGGRFQAGLALLLSSLTATASDDQPITITFYDFPPKMLMQDGKMSGIRFDEMNRIADEAGLSVTWVETTLKTEADLLNAGLRKFCATGRAYNSERARLWTYVPYALDLLPRHVLVASRVSAAKVVQHGSVKTMLSDSNLRGVFVKEFIYGPNVDPYLDSAKAEVSYRPQQIEQALDMVRMKRADFTLVPIHIWDAFRSKFDQPLDLIAIDGLGTIEEQNLYVVCSRSVAPEIVNALSGAMRRLGYKPVTLPPVQ
ncbi:transporter substrate-binding domain-containing protein [Kordiimonas lipolytica]|uniref:Transporter substrate-binding domain-containing protein n=1 Tax=Kordiimonas lipolytica TaxID=1662421 RepID=A0ABV8U5L1_9PROT|nr:transporter substrate-binding domain-containing protein [Kordiimonas lipolytica]